MPRQTDPTFLWSGFVASSDRDDVLFSVLNRSTRDQEAVVTIARIDVASIVPPPGQNAGSSTITGRWSFFRTSAQACGITIPPVAMSTAASLPSQVLCAQFPSVTIGAQLASRLILFHDDNKPGFNVVAAPVAGVRVDTGRQFGFAYQFGSRLQHLTIREGEGFAFGKTPNDADGVPDIKGFHCTVMFTDGTNTFVLKTIAMPYGEGFATVGIFNGSGSGVVLRIVSVEMTYLMGNTTIANSGQEAAYQTSKIRFARLTAGASNGGESVTPIAMDTAYAFPSDIAMVRSLPWTDRIDARFIPPHQSSSYTPFDLGYPSQNQELARRLAGTIRVQYVGACNQGNPSFQGGGAFAPENDFFLDRLKVGLDFSRGNKSNAGALVLRAGEGFGVVSTTNMIQPWLYVQAAVTVRRPTSPRPASTYVS